MPASSLRQRVGPREARIAALNRPAFTALVVGLLTAVVLVALVIRDHGDVSKVVHAGPPSTNAAQAPPWLTVRPADQAYDGQFFFRLGVSPVSKAPEVAGVTYDVAALRNARWLYGALAWLLTAGHPAAVPWALLLINLFAAAALGGVAGALARSSGRHAAWGLMLALYPGYAYTLTLDTSELLAGALALGGLLAGRRGRWAPAAVLFAGAVITRDTTVVIPAGIGLGGAYLAVQGGVRSGRRQFMAGTAGVVVFGAWQLLQRLRFDAWPLTQSRKANLSGPFVGVGHELGKLLPPHGGAAAFRLLSLVFLFAVLLAAVASFRGSSLSLPEKVSWLLSIVVVATLNGYLWSGATAFMRAGTETYLLSMLIVLGHRGRLAAYLAPFVGGLWMLTIVSQLVKG